MADKPQGELVIQTIAMPKDTNRDGDIFGGWLVAQMDLGSAILATKTAKSRVVTVAIEGMAFLHPVGVGDTVISYVGGAMPAGAASDPNAGRSFSIWVNGAAAVAAPTAIDTSSLADLGWREAVAFKGDQVQQGLTSGATK